MSIKCGWASQSENKTANGKKGDQTKLEVKIGEYYNFGQNKVIRFKSVAKAKLGAKAMEEICKNNNIGYGQKDRETLYNECKKIKWDINKVSKIGLCNADCSETCAVCINLSYGKELIPSGVYTGNIVNVCEKTGLFDILKNEKYYKNDNYLKIGDMPIKEGHHIIMALQNGAKALNTEKKPTLVNIKLNCNLYKNKKIVDGKILSLKVGNKVTFIKDIGNGWSKCLYNSKEGYIKNSSLKKSNLSGYKKGKIKKLACFREKNSIKSPYTCKIPKGTIVEVISIGKSWSNVKYKGKSNFISNKKIKMI